MNLYGIILILVTLAGLAISLWGWLILRQSKQRRQWPSVTGVIEASEPHSEQDDLLPNIVYRYEVGGETYRRSLQFPGGTNPMPEFAQSYVDKYPVGAEVQVYYQPDRPGQSTLEPQTRGDWMILALGILMTVGAAASLLVTL